MLKQVLKSGWEKFMRDKGSSSAALVVMMAVIGTVTFLFMLQGISAFLIDRLQSAVDISAYFTEEATEEEMFAFRDSVLLIPEVASAEYISKDEALAQFIASHQNEPDLLESVEVIGKNPFPASLNIKAKSPWQYQTITQFLESQNSSIIQEIDYHKRASVIDQLVKLTEGIQYAVLAFTLALAFLATLVAFNTIRLTIYSSREEIEIMRLVGASNGLIRAPFVLQGILSGIFASFLVLIIALPLFWRISPELESFLSGFQLFPYFLSHLHIILSIQIVVGALIGMLSSMIAIRKYLKV